MNTTPPHRSTTTSTRPQSHPGSSSEPIFAAHHELRYKLHRQATELRKIQASERRGEGQYNINKLDTFEKYQNSTNMSTAIVVLAVTPLPCVIIVMLLECTPLQDPSLGWRGNLAYLARTFCGTFVTAISMVIVTQECIPEIAFTWKQLVVIGVCQSGFYVATTILLAEASGMFPTPFAMAICLGPMLGSGMLLSYLFARHRIPGIANFSKRYLHIMEIFSVASLPMVVYPAYTTAFMQLSSRQHLWFSLLLPVVKQAFRSAQLKTTAKRYMDASSVMTTSALMFHILFIIACIQHSKASSMMVLLLLWNVAYTVWGCKNIVQFSRTIAAHRKASLGRNPSVEGIERRHCMGRRMLVLLEKREVALSLFRCDSRVFLSSYHRYQNPKWIAFHQELLQRVTPCTVPVTVTNHQRSTVLSVVEAARASWNSFLASIYRRQTNKLPDTGEQSASKIQNFLPPLGCYATEIRVAIGALHVSESFLLHSFSSVTVCFIYEVYVVVVYSLRSRNYITAITRVASFDQVSSILKIIGILHSLEISILVAYLVTRTDSDQSAIRKLRS